MDGKIKKLDTKTLTKLFIGGSRWLSKYADILNDLNVYPVPDGDTGTNMSMTMQAVENELVKLDHTLGINEFCDVVSDAILLGARGNSGTILSQIIQGFLEPLYDIEEIAIEKLVEGFEGAKEKAYKAVSNPVEGTILTVIRIVSEKTKEYNGPEEIKEFINFAKEAAREAVEDTPNQLPKLKEAGVVDAGGMGIFYLLEGFEKALTDESMIEDLNRVVKSQSQRKEQLENIKLEGEDIGNKYCTEFIIESADFDMDEYKAEISKHGDSIVAAQTRTKTKTHIHTNNPGIVLEIAGAKGNLNNIKIDNMLIQHNHLTNFKEEEKVENEALLIKNENTEGIAYLTVADNKKLGELFIREGASGVILGGQTQNPSVADFEEALKVIESERVVILPNNKNIIGSAKIAAERATKEVTILETTSMLEGHHAIKYKCENLVCLTKDLTLNKSIEITQAVRDTKVSGLEIKVGDWLGLVDGKISHKGATQDELIKELLEKYVTSQSLGVIVAKGKEGTDLNIKELVGDLRYEEYQIDQENYSYYIYIENRDPDLPEIAIVTDSTSDLTKEMIGDLNIDIVPLKIKLDDEKYYKDGVDITKERFWKILLNGGSIPKTSQPSPGDFKKTYEKLFARGYKKIISIHLSSKLSGTQQAARVAREMTGREEDIDIVDSKSVTFALGHMVTESATMVKKGYNRYEILEWLESITSRMEVYFVVKELEFLEKGGRLNKASSTMGDIFKIKPILKLSNGQVGTEKKAIGEVGAMRYMEKLIKASSKDTSVYMYTAWGGTEEARQNAEQLRVIGSKIKRIQYKGRYEIGSTIGSHSGPVYGIGIFPKIR